jgi:hypothetical protein
MKLAYMIPRVNKELKQAHLSCPWHTDPYTLKYTLIFSFQ